MKRVIIIILSNILFFNNLHAQKGEFEKFVESFPKLSTSKIIDFITYSWKGTTMSKQEASEFVYHGDSSKLYCLQYIVDEETEKTVGSSLDLYLPMKVFILPVENAKLVVYAAFECSYNPITVVKSFLIDSDHSVQDSMIVAKFTDYGNNYSGIYNPNTCKLFILRETHAFLYKINAERCKFELIKDQDNITGATDDLEKVVERIGWRIDF